MVTVMRVAGNKEGKGGKGHDIGNKGGMQQRGQWQQRQEQWQQGWQASNVDKGNGNGNGNNLGNVDGDKAGCVKYSRYLSLQNMWLSPTTYPSTLLYLPTVEYPTYRALLGSLPSGSVLWSEKILS